MLLLSLLVLASVPPEQPPPDEEFPAELEAPKRQSPEALKAEKERMLKELRERPRSLADRWTEGGFGMFPVAVGMMWGLACGGLALLLSLINARRAAVVTAGLCLGGGGFAFSAGWLGYLNGM